MIRKYLFFIILAIAIFLRFWQLGNIPSGVHTDEADMGYSAYSILNSGLDPKGLFNPLAFSDNNTGGTHPPVYTYILLPLVKVMGLNIFVERLPSAVAGVFSVVVLYFLLRKLSNSDSVSLIGTTLFTLNPWTLHMSRQGLLEALCILVILLGVYLFIKARDKPFFYYISAFLFGISLFVYNAPKIFLPAFLPFLFYYQKDNLLKYKKYAIVFLLIVGVFYLGIAQMLFFGEDKGRYSRESVFSFDVEAQVNSERFQTTAPLKLSSIFHNKLTVDLKRFETSYIHIFSLDWFFGNGTENLQHGVGNHGEFYLFELPFFFLGMYYLFRRRRNLFIFVFGWMLAGALPGGLTTGNYALRSVLVLPSPIIFSSFGIWYFFEHMKHTMPKKLLPAKAIFAAVAVIFIASYLFTYFFDYPVYASEWWSKQQDDAIQYAITKQHDFPHVFLDGGEPWAITYAYYTKLDPKIYQSSSKNWKMYKNIPVMQIDNITFGNFPLDKVEKPSDYFPKGSLLITRGDNFPGASSVKTFFDPGKIRPIFRVFVVQ
ncbi:MAG TPA: glycosyltransferase family 39 protein [Candidatus Saccharimonadales bacterium]|nr:glycosyltransferase family 39 protein [Candidatus Saccharimonadales bacterium]